MAGFLDALNQGIGNLTGTPMGQLGMALMSASQPMQGNPGGAARLGMALGDMQNMQYRQAQLQQAQQLRQIQQQELGLRMQRMTQEEDTRKALQQMAQENPSMFGSPIVAAMLGAGADMGMAGQMKNLLQPQAKIGAMPFESTITNPDGTQQLQRINPQTGLYENVGSSYAPVGLQRLQQQADQFQQTQAQKDQDQALRERQVNGQLAAADTAARSADARVMAEQRKMQAAQLKNQMSKNDLEGGFNGAMAQLDDTIRLATDLMNSPGFAGNFGLRGQVPNIPGSDAANAAALMEQLKAQAGLTGLVRLEQQGVKLTPVSNTDLSTAQNSVINLDKAQDANSAKSQLQQYIDAANRAKQEAGRNYGTLRSLYDIDTGAPQGQQMPVVGTVMDGYRYNGGDPASPSSWSKQ